MQSEADNIDSNPVPSFDIGAPRIPQTDGSIQGNIDDEFDDFSPESPATAAGSSDHPWKVKIENNESRQITLTPGAVNNTIPLIGSARMIISPRPVLTLPNVAIVGIYLKITVDGSMESTAVEVIAAEIETVSNSLDLQTGGIGYELIATATIDEGEIVSHQQFVKTKLYHRAYLKHIFWT